MISVGKLRKCPQTWELMAFRTFYAYKSYGPGFYIYAYNRLCSFLVGSVGNICWWWVPCFVSLHKKFSC
jgi:hypothetical protein